MSLPPPSDFLSRKDTEFTLFAGLTAWLYTFERVSSFIITIWRSLPSTRNLWGGSCKSPGPSPFSQKSWRLTIPISTLLNAPLLHEGNLLRQAYHGLNILSLIWISLKFSPNSTTLSIQKVVVTRPLFSTSETISSLSMNVHPHWKLLLVRQKESWRRLNNCGPVYYVWFHIAQF